MAACGQQGGPGCEVQCAAACCGVLQGAAGRLLCWLRSSARIASGLHASARPRPPRPPCLNHPQGSGARLGLAGGVRGVDQGGQVLPRHRGRLEGVQRGLLQRAQQARPGELVRGCRWSWWLPPSGVSRGGWWWWIGGGVVWVWVCVGGRAWMDGLMQLTSAAWYTCLAARHEPHWARQPLRLHRLPTARTFLRRESCSNTPCPRYPVPAPAPPPPPPHHTIPGSSPRAPAVAQRSAGAGRAAGAAPPPPARPTW